MTIYESSGVHYIGRRCWELNLLNFKRRRLRGYINAVYSDLMWESRKDRDRRLSELYRERTRGNRFKLDYEVLSLYMKSLFIFIFIFYFTMKVITNWNSYLDKLCSLLPCAYSEFDWTSCWSCFEWVIGEDDLWYLTTQFVLRFCFMLYLQFQGSRLTCTSSFKTQFCELSSYSCFYQHLEARWGVRIMLYNT